MMVADIKHRKTPEEEELSKKLTELSELESKLTQRELDLATLHGELRAFEVRYFRVIGTRYAELDEIEAQVAELQAQINFKDKKSKERATQARAKARESAHNIDVEQEPLKHDKFTPSESLKKLYREVAKNIHPDLANDEEERARRQRFMAEANRAYEESDETRLGEILREWEISPESVKGEGVGAELVRVIRKITQVKERLSVIETEFDKLKGSEIYQLKIRVEEAENEGRGLLREMAFQLDEQIAFAKQRLKEMKAKRSRLA
jgi:DnaJ-domain-containing protein 1